MQYEFYFIFFTKTRFVFQKVFFQKVHLEKGGRLIIRVILYPGQYGIKYNFYNNKLYWTWSADKWYLITLNEYFSSMNNFKLAHV